MNELQPLADHLAAAEADLAAATARRDEAVSYAQDVRNRLDEKARRKHELACRRVNGGAQPGDDAELILLAGDMGVLEKALADAEEAIPSIATQQAVASRCRYMLETATAAAKQRILVEKATAADALLCRLIEEIVAGGGGLNLLDLWQPSRALHVTICREFPPA